MRRVAHAARNFRLSLKRKPAKKLPLFVVADFCVLAKKNLCRRLHVRLFFCSGRAADVRCQPRADVRKYVSTLLWGALRCGHRLSLPTLLAVMCSPAHACNLPRFFLPPAALPQPSALTLDPMRAGTAIPAFLFGRRLHPPHAPTLLIAARAYPLSLHVWGRATCRMHDPSHAIHARAPSGRLCGLAAL